MLSPVVTFITFSRCFFSFWDKVESIALFFSLAATTDVFHCLCNERGWKQQPHTWQFFLREVSKRLLFRLVFSGKNSERQKRWRGKKATGSLGPRKTAENFSSQSAENFLLQVIILVLHSRGKPSTWLKCRGKPRKIAENPKDPSPKQPTLHRTAPKSAELYEAHPSV